MASTEARKQLHKTLRTAANEPRSRFAAGIASALCAVVFVLMSALCLGACGGPTVGSIGAVLSRDSLTGAVHVRETPEGLAAEQAGLLPGDRVKMVDGELVDGLDAARIKGLLRGPVGSKVTLTVVRGEQILHLEITRQPLGVAPAPTRRHERIE